MTQTFLHIGCGPQRKAATTRGFNRGSWQEVTVDSDPAFKPDHVAGLTDLSAIASGSVDAVFCSHNLERLHVHEVIPALKEVHRVLKPAGFAVITSPDLQGVAELIAADKLTEAAYESAIGPIRPVDIVFGHSAAIAAGNKRLVRHCGFTQKVLVATLQAAGFRGFASARRPAPFLDLWVIATPDAKPEAELREIAAQHFPSGRGK
jgi:hypothetical protein